MGGDDVAFIQFSSGSTSEPKGVIVIGTVQGLEVVSVDAERGVLLVKGAVPGATGNDVIVRPTVKA